LNYIKVLHTPLSKYKQPFTASPIISPHNLVSQILIIAVI